MAYLKGITGIKLIEMRHYRSVMLPIYAARCRVDRLKGKRWWGVVGERGKIKMVE